MRIKEIFTNKFSSKYGDSNNSFGQPLGVKSIVLISVESSDGIIRSHELYAGIYVPDVIDVLVEFIKPQYINKDFSLENFPDNSTGIPFITNSGLFKSIKGAIDSCIFQIILQQANITLVQGIRNLLNKEIRREKGSEDIKYYASGGSVAFSENECVADCSIAISANYDGFKMRCGWQEFSLDTKRVFSVNEYVKNNIENKDFSLMIDFIQGTLNPKINFKDLEKYISEFKSLNILWFEEPLDPDNYSLYKNLPYNYLFNFSLGESFSSFNEYMTYQDILNYYQIDVTHIGGFQEAVKVLNYFSNIQKKITFTSHVWGSQVSLLLNLALCKACNLIKWFEIPLLSFEINKHLFQQNAIDPRTLNDEELDMLLSSLNINQNPKYEFRPGSGYRI